MKNLDIEWEGLKINIELKEDGSGKIRIKHGLTGSHNPEQFFTINPRNKNVSPSKPD